MKFSLRFRNNLGILLEILFCLDIAFDKLVFRMGYLRQLSKLNGLFKSFMVLYRLRREDIFENL